MIDPPFTDASTLSAMACGSFLPRSLTDTSHIAMRMP
jgi:hypothetical protein